MKEKNNRGITLIALVITIIVLLLLVGVTIASVTGENGILNKAAEARNNTQEASVKEKIETEVLGSYDSNGEINIEELNNNLKSVEGLEYNGNVISDSNKIESLPAIVNIDGYDAIITEQGNIDKTKTLKEGKSDEMLTQSEDTPIIVSGKIVKIPAGFKIADDSGTTIDDGIVIEDSKKNQFVWVPVSSKNFETEFIRKKGIFGGIEDNISDYGEANALGKNEIFTETQTTQEEAQNMYASVKRNEGFYIARYEAGKDKDGNVIFQKGADVYTNIQWSANGKMQETTGTTGGAVELSRNFATANNYTTVMSTLIYGVQWDAVMDWMKEISNPNVEGKKYIKDSTGMGWYNNNSENTTHKTGIDIGKYNNGANQVKKVYDLAGNAWEWTMECVYITRRVLRGGDYFYAGDYCPASSRGTNYPYYSSSDDSFRCTLYLKN